MATNNGYIRLYLPNHPNADSNGLIYEHQVVASQMLGRPLKDGEIVHHEDRNRANNSPYNLKVFASNADHSGYHKGLNYYQDQEGVYHCIFKIFYCISCGKPITKSSKTGHCVECAHINERKTNRPSREELKKLIRIKSFLSIGKEYGVSDNAIRKWCKSYNLPYKKTIISKITDEEWLKI